MALGYKKNKKMWIDEFMIGHQCHKRQFTCKVTCLTFNVERQAVNIMNTTVFLYIFKR